MCLWNSDLRKIRLAPDLPKRNFCVRRGVSVPTACVSNFFFWRRGGGKGPQLLLRAGSQAVHVKIKISGVKFYISLTVHLGTVLVNNQFDVLFQRTYLFNFCTCFKQPSAHHQENHLYQYITGIYHSV
jgi:hypothetical protein